MPRQCRYFLHCGVLPDYDLVETVAVSADQLVIGLREDKIADLAASVYCTYGLQSERVPETNVLVSRATSGCQKTSVQRTPVDRFYSGLVLRKLAQRLLIVARHHVPDH